MLTTDQKETILRGAGVATPAFPSPGVLWRQQRHDPGTAAQQWAHAINALFVAYSAALLQCHASAETETRNAAASGARKARRPRRRSHAMG